MGVETLRVVERHPSGLVRLDGLPGWWRLGKGPCGTCGGSLWAELHGCGLVRLVCERCVKPRKGEAVARVVRVEEVQGG